MKLPSTVQRATAALTRASVAVCAVMGAFAAPPAQALDVYMGVGQFSQTMPDGTTVQMWGYRIGPTPAAAANGPMSSPGPAITVPPNDGTLRIRLLNRLSVPTSIVLHGQSGAMAPVYKSNATVNATTVTSDCVPGNNLDCRVRSFTHETPPGNQEPVDYVFTVKPGTFLYQSGTLPQIQVQMGLYGMTRKNAPATATSGLNAYPGVPYDDEIALLLSEVDPAVHAAVASGTFTGSTLNYDPKYFRVHRYRTANNDVPENVTASPSKSPLSIRPGKRMLLRMLNAGLKSRSMVVDDGHWYVMAEDGNPYPFPREQYSVFLPAAKTSDVWFTPTVGTAEAIDRTMTVFDRNLALSNNNAQAVGGMLFQMQIDTAPRPSLDISNCPLTGTEDQPYAGCTVSSKGPGQRSYSLDIAPIGMTIHPATGVIAWTPTNDQAQRPADPTLTNPLRVRAVSSNGGIDVSPIVQIAVTNTNDAPLALNDSYTVRGGALTVGALQSVRANDSDPDGDALGSVSLFAAPADPTKDFLTLNPDGTFSFTTKDFTADRAATFTYQVTDGQALSNHGMVTLNIKANVAPTARDDMVAMLFTSGGTIDIDVLANDFDLDNNMVADSLAIFTSPNCGGEARLLPGAGPGGRPLIQYKLPATRTNCGTAGGTDTLTYTVSDAVNGLPGLTSAPAFVRVNIQ